MGSDSGLVWSGLAWHKYRLIKISAVRQESIQCCSCMEAISAKVEAQYQERFVPGAKRFGYN